MAVLVEAISVVVRRDSIDVKYEGGWKAFERAVPNGTLCTDNELVRVGFTTPDDVGTFIEELQRCGLTFLNDGKAIDLAVVDQIRGPTTAVDWMEFAKMGIGDNGERMSACWLWDEPRDRGFGTYMPSQGVDIALPSGWTFEGSLSEQCNFISNEDMSANCKFLRHEDGVDVYLDTTTNKEIYLARS